MSQYISLITTESQWVPDPAVDARMQEQLVALSLPAFHEHQVQIPELKKIVAPFQQYSNIIIIANGGSRTSALAYWQSLAHLRNEKTVEFLSTMEPDVIAALKARYSPKDTVVMPISKSGTNVDVLEPLMQFF